MDSNASTIAVTASTALPIGGAAASGASAASSAAAAARPAAAAASAAAAAANKRQASAAATTPDLALQRDPRSVQFQVDGNRVVTTVVDENDNTVVVQVPDEDMIAIAKAIDRMQGFLVKDKA